MYVFRNAKVVMMLENKKPIKMLFVSKSCADRQEQTLPLQVSGLVWVSQALLCLPGAEVKPRPSRQGRSAAVLHLPGPGMCVSSHDLATGTSSAFHLYPESSSVCNVLLTQAAETTVSTSEVRKSPSCV